jgi:hypothetical protein
MGIIGPISQHKISSSQEYSSKKCQPQTYMHSDIVSVFLFLQSDNTICNQKIYLLAEMSLHLHT